MPFPQEKTHSTEQIHFTRVLQFGTHFSSESTEAMRIKCLAQGLSYIIIYIAIKGGPKVELQLTLSL